MTKYAPLTTFLESQGGYDLTLTFEQITEILGGPLPESSYAHVEHWRGRSPDRPGGAITSAGWAVESLNLGEQSVTLVRERPPTPGAAGRARPKALPDASGPDWDWEGNLVNVLASHLRTQGWRRLSQANTATHEHGVDLLVERDGQQLAIEVKGFPSRVYAPGHAKAGQAKKWLYPAARSYFGDMLLTALLLHVQLPGSQVAVALPDRPTFTTLIRRLGAAFSHLGIGVFVIGESGAVSHALEPGAMRW